MLQCNDIRRHAGVLTFLTAQHYGIYIYYLWKSPLHDIYSVYLAYPVVYLPQKVQWIDLLVVPTLHLCEPALNYFILSQEKQTFLNILGGRFYVLVTPSWSVTTFIVGAKGKLSKTRVTRLVENVFPDLFHVMVFLPFPLSFHFLTIFFINQTIEKTIDLSLLYVVFPNGKKITL